jgi:hypothetical protein
MKTEAMEKTVKQLKDIREARKAAGRSDWASQYVLAPLVDKIHKKECSND